MSEDQKTRLSILRNKLKKHYSLTAHESACLIFNEKKLNNLPKLLEENINDVNKSTYNIFCIAYYLAKYNRPFDDHFKFIELQMLNGVKLGYTLHLLI